MNTPVRALILDDDPLAQQTLQAHLEAEIPGVSVTCRLEPDPQGDFDIYFLDNQFDGVDCAARLAKEIRQNTAEKLVIAFSGTLNSKILKSLINAGCDGVCDKTEPDDLPNALRIARNFADSLKSQPDAPPGPSGVIGAVRAISDLLREWNTRLDTQATRLNETK